MNIILIEARVEELLSKDQTGHGFDHTKRVREMAVRFANDSIKNGESVDVEAVEIAALLHDVDDYKLVAKDAAETLENAQRIMVEAGCGKQMRLRVIEIIQNMGYSKALKGIRPLSLEGQIVSDADLCDAIGITGIMRAYQYAIEKAFRVPRALRFRFPNRPAPANRFGALRRNGDHKRWLPVGYRQPADSPADRARRQSARRCAVRRSDNWRLPLPDGFCHSHRCPPTPANPEAVPHNSGRR